MSPVKRLGAPLSQSLVWISLTVGFALAPQAALARDSKAAAEVLFVEGRTLMDRGDYAAACAKFEASQKLDAGVGTMLNLADCYEKSGRTASAWAEYREVVPLARAAGSEERAVLAEARAKALEPDLSTLTIHVSETPPGVRLEVLRDGLPVDPAMFSTAIPVDPGQHEVVVRAPGYQSWTSRPEVGRAGARVVIEVPALEAVASGDRADEPAVTAPEDSSSRPSTQKTWAAVTGGAGLLTLGTGGAFLGLAISELTAAKDLCPTYPNSCSLDSREHNERAGTFGDTATALLIVGGVGLAAGTALWLTAPKTRSTRVGVGLGTFHLKGTF